MISHGQKKGRFSRLILTLGLFALVLSANALFFARNAEAASTTYYVDCSASGKLIIIPSMAQICAPKDAMPVSGPGMRITQSFSTTRRITLELAVRHRDVIARDTMLTTTRITRCSNTTIVTITLAASFSTVWLKPLSVS